MNSVNEEILSGSSFNMTIPPQIKKALVKYWGSEEIIDHPEIIVELGPGFISRINRIGSKSLVQIAQALDALGYIDSHTVWLMSAEQSKGKRPDRAEILPLDFP